MNNLKRIVEGVCIDVERFRAVAQRERNLAVAFEEALHIDKRLRERFDAEEDLDRAQELWIDHDSYWYATETEWDGPPFEAFEQLGATVEHLMCLMWDSLGPMSWDLSWYVARNLLGYDVVFTRCEFTGYPTMLIRETGLPGLDEAISQAVCNDLAHSEEFGLPSRIENRVPEIIPATEVLHAVYRRLERTDGWDDVRSEQVNTALYPDHAERQVRILKETLSRVINEPGAFRVRPDPDPADPPDREEKARLITNYMRRSYFQKR